MVATGTYADLGLRQLRAPARDAEDLAQVLAAPGIGGFAVTTVIDQSAHQIRLAVEDFLAGRGTGDLLLVYLSCHGLLDVRRRLYFAATDTRKDRLGATGVEAAWVLDHLEHCRARRQILILDRASVPPARPAAHGVRLHRSWGWVSFLSAARFLSPSPGRMELRRSADGDEMDMAEWSRRAGLTRAASYGSSQFFTPSEIIAATARSSPPLRTTSVIAAMKSIAIKPLSNILATTWLVGRSSGSRSVITAPPCHADIG